MNKRRRFIGTVTSNKMEKTAVVEIVRKFRHPLYHKVVKARHTVKAHDELGCNVGDKVQIVESKPISKTKRWVVEQIIKIEERQDDLIEQVAVVEPVDLVETAEPVVESADSAAQAGE